MFDNTGPLICCLVLIKVLIRLSRSSSHITRMGKSKNKGGRKSKGNKGGPSMDAKPHMPPTKVSGQKATGVER